jgi:hypothetical protein
MCTDDFTVCASNEVVADGCRLAEVEGKTMSDQPELITIARYRDFAEAEMAKGRLNSAGIDAFIIGENAGVLYGNTIDNLQLQVNPNDEADALAVLAVVAEPGEAERAEEEDAARTALEKPVDQI